MWAIGDATLESFLTNNIDPQSFPFALLGNGRNLITLSNEGVTIISFKRFVDVFVWLLREVANKGVKLNDFYHKYTIVIDRRVGLEVFNCLCLYVSCGDSATAGLGQCIFFQLL